MTRGHRLTGMSKVHRNEVMERKMDLCEMVRIHQRMKKMIDESIYDERKGEASYTMQKVIYFLFQVGGQIAASGTLATRAQKFWATTNLI